MKNTLKELRKQANLTQLKASNLFHVSLYVNYRCLGLEQVQFRIFISVECWRQM